jgi:hypothetical protein
VPLAGRNEPRLAPEDVLGNYEVYERIRLDEDLQELRYVGWEAYEAVEREPQKRLDRWLEAIELILSIPMIGFYYFLCLFQRLVWVPVLRVVIGWNRRQRRG